MSTLGFQPRGNRTIQAPGGQSSVVLGTDESPFKKKPSPVTTQADEQVSVEAHAVEEEIIEEISLDLDDETKQQILEEVSSQNTADGMMQAIASVGKKVQDSQQEKIEQAGNPRALKDKLKFPQDQVVTGKATQAVQKLREILKGRGSHGIISLGKKFKSMDDNGNNKLDFEEFNKGMVELGFDKADVNAMFRYFDEDCSGDVSYNEFLETVKEPMNPRRLKLVGMAFKVLDKDGSGKIDMGDIQGRYDVSRHPDFMAGVKSRDEILGEFLSQFEKGNNDGVVELEEFEKYYHSVSACIDHDDYFELMIRNVWHISGGEGWCENTTCQRVLVTHGDGSMSVQEVTDDFDIDNDDDQAIKAKLESQGVDVKKVAKYGYMEKMEDASGKAPDLSGHSQTAAEAKRRNLGSSIVL